MKICKLHYILFALVFSTFNVLAEEAPVYDVDNYPPQFDGAEKAPVKLAPVKSVAQENDDNDQYTDDTDATPMAAPTVKAAVPTPQPVDTSNLSTEQRVTRLETQLNNMLDISARLTNLQNLVQAQRGQIDELTHQLQQLQSQQKLQYADLDKRFTERGVAITPPVAASTEKPIVQDQPNVAEEQHIYQTAYSQIKAKKYDKAAVTLQKMLEKYPSGQFAANAHYWLGELDGLMGKNEQAIKEFSTVVKNYPDSPKLADSQLKLGLIYAGQFKWSKAKAEFKQLINRFPGSSSAQLASEQLKQIKAAGH